METHILRNIDVNFFESHAYVGKNANSIETLIKYLKKSFEYNLLLHFCLRFANTLIADGLPSII